MEMLAEMEGTEEDLKGLNHAEHKPEDDMHTDEWMYELKHRKSWSTGKYVPSEDSWKPKKELLTEAQVKLVKTTWEGVDADAFGKQVHQALAKEKASAQTANLNEAAQSKRVSGLVGATANTIGDTDRLSVVFPDLEGFITDYSINGKEIATVFGEQVMKALSRTIDPFNANTKAAWQALVNLLIHQFLSK